MNDHLISWVGASPPVVATAIAAVTGATPIEYGIVGIVLIIGIIPVLRWMMNRLDQAQDREDKLVGSLDGILVQLKSMNSDSQMNHAMVMVHLTSLLNKKKEESDEE